MHFFGGKEESVEYGALIDIGSGSVAVGIVESKKSEPHPKLIYSYRAPLRLYTDAKTESLYDTRKVREAVLANSLQFFSEGLHALQSHAPNAKVQRLFVTCASPWAYTLARSVHYEAKDSFRIVKSVVADLVTGAEVEILARVRENAVVQVQDFEVVEKATVDIIVNGYSVHEAVGLSGTTLGLTHITGLVPKDIIQTTHEVHDKLFPETELRIHTFMLVMYCVLRDVFPDVHSSCIIDVTGEATEFGIVENNLLIENSFVPLGTHSLLRSMSEGTKRPIADIHTSVLECVSDDVISLAEFDPFASTYIHDVEAHLNTMLANRSLPEHIILATHMPFTKLFTALLSKAIENATGTPHTITTIDPRLLYEVSGKEKMEDNDVYLTMAARFFHKLHGCAEISIED